MFPKTTATFRVSGNECLDPDSPRWSRTVAIPEGGRTVEIIATQDSGTSATLSVLVAP